MKIEISEKTFEVVYDAMLERIADRKYVSKGKKDLVALEEDGEAMYELMEIDKKMFPERWKNHAEVRNENTEEENRNKS